MFTKSKSKYGGSKTIPYEEFRTGLIPAIGLKKSLDNNTIMTMIIACAGPTSSATVADNVRFHDDKSTFTGSHSRRSSATGGGVAPGAEAGSPAYVLDPNVGPGPDSSDTPNKTGGGAARSASRRGSRRSSAGAMTGQVPLMNVYDTYTSQASDMDSRTFVKLLKDTNIINSKFDTNAADLSFNKAKSKLGAGVKKITFELFCDVALVDVAEKTGKSLEDIVAMLTKTQGRRPSMNGTVADNVRFHDDKSTFTGSHAAGGPSFEVNAGP